MPESERQETGFYSSYSEFAKTLRTWFIAYGIGGPVLLLTHADLADKVVRSGRASRIAALFLTGVAFQVGAALTYKVCMWYLYLAEMKPSLRQTPRHKVVEYLSEAFWLEMLFDIGTIGAFTAATLMLVSVLL